MEYIREERNRHQGCEVRVESPRTQYCVREPQRVSYDSAGTPRSSSANPLKSTADSRDLARSSLDIKDIVRASFLRERARASVDKDVVQQSTAELRERESPRFGSLRSKEPSPSSVEVRGEVVRTETPRSSSSPRLSIRLREAVRAAVENSKGKHVRSSSDSSDIVAAKSRDTPRSSSETRLLVELRESPRLTRDAPRYSCDGRDVLRLSVDSSKDTLRVAAQRARDSPRLSVDGRGSPRLSRSDVNANGQIKGQNGVTTNSSHLQPVCLESDWRDQSAADQKKRVPSLLARLMGLEDLPDDESSAAPSTTPPKKPSKESKILKGLLQYTPLPDIKPTVECRQVDLHNVDYYNSRPSRSSYETPDGYPPAGPQADWKPIPEALGHLRLSAKQSGMESVPSSIRKETREGGSLRHEDGVPKQLTEAVLTVLKHSGGRKRVPMSYAEMENRLRQLRLRSSCQDHKTLMQVLDAMQTKGLLNGPRSRESLEETKESRQQLDSRQQTTPRHIMLPRYQEPSSESTKVRNLQELRKLGSKLQDQVFGCNASDGPKVLRQSQSVSKRVTAEQEPHPEASIVVIKPLGKPVKKCRTQNPALLLESMPSTRSPKGGRESSGKSSPWGSPANRSSRSQPGYGFGREPTNRFNPEDTLSSKRRERIIARSSREVQIEPLTSRSPRLITVPHPSGKLRSGPKDAPEKPSSKLVSGIGSRVSESGRRSRSTSAVTKEREESSKLIVGSLRSHSSRDLLSIRKSAAEPEVVQTKVLRRSNSDGKLQFNVMEKDRLSGSPLEAGNHRSRSSSKSRGSSSDTDAPSTPTKRKPVPAGPKPSSSGERIKEKSSSTASGTQGCTTPRSIARNIVAEFSKKKEEQSCVIESLQQVRVTEGDATDQSGARTPLVGLTNRLQNVELVDLDQKDNQGLRTPRGGMIVKKVLPNQEDSNLVADIIDVTIDQDQPSPISVLDGAAFHEEDLSPLQLSKSLDVDDGLCLNGENVFTLSVGEGDTALQDSVNHVASEVVPPAAENADRHVSKESFKSVPPRGEDKIIGLLETEERSYVRDVLLVSGATMGIKAVNPAGNPIDSTVYDYLDEKKGIADYGWEKNYDGPCDSVKREGMKARQAMDRRMLFDTVNDILTTMLVPYVNVKPWMQALVLPPLRKRPTGQRLVQLVWDELQSLPPREPCDDICESLYIVLQKDLALPANGWVSFSEEAEEIGLEIERMIFKELVDEVVCCLSHSTGKMCSEL
ncbi:hypothetical protein R1flu_021536 [Riccia fluitans]|uniref:DUF4378 domain-containing protein n=1 Tax=Riccia fluitans TaxID=41844 RepID=A0ABD1ZPM5_9MARC